MATTIETRIKLFFLICLPVRIGLVLLAYIIPLKYLQIMGYITLVVSVRFAYLFKNYKSGDKGGFGGNLWWNNMRLVHSITYLIFSLMAIRKSRKAYLLLIADIIIGAISFINQYFIN